MELRFLPNSNPKAVTAVVVGPNETDTVTTPHTNTNNNCCDPLSSQNDKIHSQPNVNVNVPVLITRPKLGIPTVPSHHQSTPPLATSLPPMLPPHPHRRTLERNHRNNMHHNNVNQQNHVNQTMNHNMNNNNNQKIHNNNSNHINNHINYTNHSNTKNNNQNHVPAHHQLPNGMIDSTKMMLDGDCGLPRSASIRRQPRRGSNNSMNGSPRITRGPSSELLHHRHYQHSPMPIRSSKRAARMGRAENIEVSSGSLNSIEV